MQQENQELHPYQTEEIDLKKLLNSLVARKFFIFGLTVFVTLLGIIYVLNLTPTYRTISSFTSPNESSIININKLQLTEESKESVFSNFLTKVSSRKLQAKVFLDGGYLNSFNPENNSIDDATSFILKTLKSVKLSPPNITEDELEFGFLTEIPYTISMKGSNPIVIANYLNDLVSSANAETIKELTDLITQNINMRLKNLYLERQLLLIKEEKKRLNDIEVLTDAAKFASSLGIIENNIKHISVGDKIISNLIKDQSKLDDIKSQPDWYLYGEKALLERVNILKNRSLDEPFVPQLVELDIEILTQESNLKETFNFNSMQISQVAMAPNSPIEQNKIRIVLLAFIGGFMMSIFLILFMNVLKPIE